MFVGKGLCGVCEMDEGEEWLLRCGGMVFDSFGEKLIGVDWGNEEYEELWGWGG